MAQPRLAPVTLLGLAITLGGTRALASVCDNATEAWTAADQMIDALDANRAPEVTRVARTLLACTPSGPQMDLVNRAMLEARLAQVELAARAVRDTLSRAPRPPANARTDAQFNAWIQHTAAPFVQQTSTRIEHDVASAVTALPADGPNSDSVRADALSLLADLYLAFGTAVRNAPPPPTIARNADLLATYRGALTQSTQPLFDHGAEGYNQVHALAQHNHLEPRGVRRAAAWLEIHGIPTAAVTPSEPAPAAATQPATATQPAAATQPAPAAEASHPWLGLSFGPVRAVEVLEPVAMALAPLMSRLASCYAPAAGTNPAPSGRITVRVAVTPAGTAQPAEIVTVDPALAPVQACVRDTMSTIRFGTSTNGSLIVQTFEFHP